MFIGLFKSIVKSIISFFQLLKRTYDFYNRSIYVAPRTYISSDVNIGDGTRINNVSHIGDCDIGSYCAIGGRLVIRSTDHYTCYLNMQDNLQRKIMPNIEVAGKSKGRVKVGNGVWIGDSVIILPGVTIGDGAVIGAGSVVVKSIPSFAIAVGNPAKVIKYRFEEEKIRVLQNLRWYEWNKSEMLKNKELFNIDINKISSDDLKEIIEKCNYNLLHHNK